MSGFGGFGYLGAGFSRLGGPLGGAGSHPSPPSGTPRQYIVASLPFPVFLNQSTLRQDMVETTYVNEGG